MATTEAMYMALSFMVALLVAMVLRYGVGVARAGQIVLCFYKGTRNGPKTQKLPEIER